MISTLLNKTKKLHLSLQCLLKWTTLLFICISCQSQNEIFRFKQSFDTYMWLSESLSISSDTPEVIVGSRNGTIKIFNIESGQVKFEQDRHGMQVVGTVWIKDRNGLITVLNDEKNNRSVAMIRDRNSFEESYRWQFNQTIKDIDYTETLWSSYVAFNFINRIQQYELRLKNRTYIYYAFGGMKFTDISYSSNYSYLYVLSKFNNYDVSAVHHIPCGLNNNWYYWIQGLLSDIQANKYDYEEHNFVFKNIDEDGNSSWKAEQYYYLHQYKFPQNRTIKFFRFCPQNYILGVTVQNQIVFYSNDYNFTQIDIIEKFSEQFIQIIQLQCKNGFIVVAGANNYLYTFELYPFEEQQGSDWIKIWLIIGIGIMICLVLSCLIYKKIMHMKIVKKAKLNQQLIDQQTLHNQPHQSFAQINKSIQQ